MKARGWREAVLIASLAVGWPVQGAEIQTFQLPAKSVFSEAMPRYPNVWFYVDASLASGYRDAVKLVTDNLRETMRLREYFGPFDNPEGSDFEVRVEHLQPWQDRRHGSLQHSHAFHLRYWIDESTDFTQSKVWRWAIYSVSALVLLALLLPALLFACNPSGPAAAAPPPQTSAPSTTAPDFELEAAGGTTVRLGDLVEANRAVVVVFYRGYF